MFSIFATFLFILDPFAIFIYLFILWRKLARVLSVLSAPRGKYVSAGNQTLAACNAGGHSTKELSRQLTNRTILIWSYVLITVIRWLQVVHPRHLQSACLNHVRVTTMEEPDQSSLHLQIKHPKQTCLGRESKLGRLSHRWALYHRAI
jgi:hypothetical protein